MKSELFLCGTFVAASVVAIACGGSTHDNPTDGGTEGSSGGSSGEAAAEAVAAAAVSDRTGPSRRTGPPRTSTSSS